MRAPLTQNNLASRARYLLSYKLSIHLVNNSVSVAAVGGL
jgi:hypothetical protein